MIDNKGIKMGHELRKDAKVLFESYETIRAADLDLRDPVIFAQCAKSVFDSVPPFKGPRK